MIPYIKTFVTSFFLGLTLFTLCWYVYVYFGLIASIGAAILILVSFWLICDQFGWIYNPPGKPHVDMAWAIVASVMAWGWVKYSANPVEAMPVLFLICCGAILGASLAFLAKPFVSKLFIALLINEKKEDDQ